jgi:hypothetical protein
MANPHSSQTDPQLFQIQLSQLQTCQDEVDILAFSCGDFKLGLPHYNPELPVRPCFFCPLYFMGLHYKNYYGRNLLIS